MASQSFTLQHRSIGRAATWTVFLLQIGYAITTSLGLLSLQSPQEPIGEPFFSIMELLILVIAPLMVVSMVAVHAYAPIEAKGYSLAALIFMILVVGITSSVHFVVLTVSRQSEAIELTGASLFFSFKWASVVYALDILAWDWFFPLSMLLAAAVLKQSRLETTIRHLMITSGILSLAGLVGVPLANMQIRNIGVIGYSVVSPLVFLLLGILFGRTHQNAENRAFCDPPSKV